MKARPSPGPLGRSEDHGRESARGDELQKALQGEGKRPDRSLQITRRTFLHKSVMTVPRGATYGWSRSSAPSISWWVKRDNRRRRSNSPGSPTTTSIRRTSTPLRGQGRPGSERGAGDETSRGLPQSTAAISRSSAIPSSWTSATTILKEVKIRKVFIPGEHELVPRHGPEVDQPLRPANWTFDHKGVGSSGSTR